MNAIAEMFSLPFMQRALIAGVLVGFMSGFYGVFVVQRGLSFLGDGLAHAAFGGVALGLLLGAEPLAVAVPFTMAVSAGIIWVQRRGRLGGDTAIGIFFAVSMALGVIFLHYRQGYSTDALSWLFGSILGVGWTDLIVTAAATLATVALGSKMWGAWAYATFDRELATADHVPVQRHDYLLNMAVAVAVVVSVRVVGAALVASFLVIPAATARLAARSLIGMTVASCMIGMGTAAGGLFISYLMDLPTGPAIILLQALVFGATLLRVRR